jgi:hypothetical protein
MLVIVCLQTLFVCLDGCDFAAVITAVVLVIPAGTLGMIEHVFFVIPAGTLGMIEHMFFVIPAGTLGMIEHVFLTHSVVTIVRVYHLHRFLLCSYVCCHSTSCVIPSDTPFQFRQLQCPVCLPFSVFINTTQRHSLQVAGSVFETSCFSHGQSFVVCS